MKMKFTTLFALAAGLLCLSSCLKDSDSSWARFYPNAIVTAKTSESGEFYLQLDENTTLKPENLSQSPFGGKEVRALLNYTDKGEYKSDVIGEKFDRLVEVNWIDSLRTKGTAASLGSTAEDDKAFGTAPIEIISNWLTIIEDGYMTLSFCAYWGDSHKVHAVNLVTGADPEDPYLLEFRHDALDDTSATPGGTRMTGIIAFDLSQLPDTEGKTVKMTIRYKSFSGESSISFDYCTGATVRIGEDMSKDAVTTKALPIE